MLYLGDTAIYSEQMSKIWSTYGSLLRNPAGGHAPFLCTNAK